jgi:hypothetical protein
MRRFIFRTLTIASGIAVSWGMARTLLADNPCHGNAIAGLAMTCNGTCPSGACPAPQGGGQGGGFAIAHFCNCTATQPTCCHLIQDAANLNNVSVYGQCDVCPMPHPKCIRAGDGTSLSPYTRACVAQGSGGGGD